MKGELEMEPSIPPSTSQLRITESREPEILPPSALAPPAELVLNTWFLLNLNDRPADGVTLGGLPNDFLGLGAACLLIFDRVICDHGGLVTEAAMPWVSSRIFTALHREGVLAPTLFDALYSESVRATLEESGLIEWARRRAHEELALIDSNNIATDDLSIPPDLRWFNSVMFMGIDLPGALHYDYHENHFSNLRSSWRPDARLTSPLSSASEGASLNLRQTDRMLAALRIAMPEFELLPPLGDRSAREAIRENIREEKRMMYRYVYGALPHEEFEAFRSSDTFAARDRLIDSASRFRAADINLGILFRVRQQTKDLRPHAQRLIRDVALGTRQLNDVTVELNAVRLAIDDALRREAQARDIQVLGGLEATLNVLEVIQAASNPASALLYATKAGTTAKREIDEAKATSAYLEALGRKHPLAWIAGAVRREQSATPRARDRASSAKGSLSED